MVNSHLTSPLQAARCFALACVLTSHALGGEATPPEAEGTDPEQTAPTEETGSLLTDAEDGWLDLTKFINQSYGFMPIVIPITEPAVGYGAVGLVAFLDKPEKVEEGAPMRPNITAVGGLATQNGTWGVFGADIRHWSDGRYESMVAGAYIDANLRYYPPEPEGSEGSEFLEYNMRVPVGTARGRYRFKSTPWSVALGYTLMSNRLKISGDLLPPGVGEPEFQVKLAALEPSVQYDSRDNIFTPSSGVFAQVSAKLYSDAWGGDRTFQIPQFLFLGFYPASEKVTLGLKAGARSAHGDVPFFLLPYIKLRGVPALRYQGETAGEVEAEVRWQLYKRFSLVGFGGHGVAHVDIGSVTRSESVNTYGLGFRYEIARGYGMHVGVDIARGPEETTLYFQFGSAWLTP